MSAARLVSTSTPWLAFRGFEIDVLYYLNHREIAVLSEINRASWWAYRQFFVPIYKQMITGKKPLGVKKLILSSVPENVLPDGDPSPEVLVAHPGIGYGNVVAKHWSTYIDSRKDEIKAALRGEGETFPDLKLHLHYARHTSSHRYDRVLKQQLFVWTHCSDNLQWSGLMDPVPGFCQHGVCYQVRVPDSIEDLALIRALKHRHAKRFLDIVSHPGGMHLATMKLEDIFSGSDKKPFNLTAIIFPKGDASIDSFVEMLIALPKSHRMQAVGISLQPVTTTKIEFAKRLVLSYYKRAPIAQPFCTEIEEIESCGCNLRALWRWILFEDPTLFKISLDRGELVENFLGEILNDPTLLNILISHPNITHYLGADLIYRFFCVMELRYLAHQDFLQFLKTTDKEFTNHFFIAFRKHQEEAKNSPDDDSIEKSCTQCMLEDRTLFQQFLDRQEPITSGILESLLENPACLTLFKAHPHLNYYIKNNLMDTFLLIGEVCRFAESSSENEFLIFLKTTEKNFEEHFISMLKKYSWAAEIIPSMIKQNLLTKTALPYFVRFLTESYPAQGTEDKKDQGTLRDKIVALIDKFEKMANSEDAITEEEIQWMAPIVVRHAVDRHAARTLEEALDWGRSTDPCFIKNKWSSSLCNIFNHYLVALDALAKLQPTATLFAHRGTAAAAIDTDNHPVPLALT